MFLPTTIHEVKKFGWNALDIILISGDSYIDSPFIGIALIGRLLAAHGYRVGVIAQPDVNSAEDITRLGEPELFWGVSGGSVDSMVANYTSLGKKRRQDDFTPGEINDRRPDRAVIAYSNLIRRYFKNTKPIVLGGIEASLRRVTHYDFWSDKLRRPILFDAKADYLIYGMGEKAVLELAAKLNKNKSAENVNGLCYISREKKYEYLQLPSHEECVSDKDKFTEMFDIFYRNNDPVSAQGLCQPAGDRFLIQNPPQSHPTTEEIDSYYELNYERELHPFHAKFGKVRALDTIRFSITTHRGCYGECNFCAIAVHQGRTIISRSINSILNEARDFTKHRRFTGTINDVGGPTANMYDFECDKKVKLGVCDDKRCVFPDTCKALKPTHEPNIRLLKEISKVNGVRKVFVASGIRYDLIADDKLHGEEYLRLVVSRHTSGQMKIAPEHANDKVLGLMGKPGKKSLEKFRQMFYKLSKEAGKEQYLTYYFIAAHPGCTEKEMTELRTFTSEKLRIHPEQVQIFSPTPSTYSTLMYYTGKNPFTGEKIFVERNLSGKLKQKEMIIDEPSAVKKLKRQFSRRDTK
ncbi:MAG: YgiQ family radical SAM protein [Melioribacteraceae bacterium]|nr:YgiQ family radical SAM protein [Melioribacteraceae bacterium]